MTHCFGDWASDPGLCAALCAELRQLFADAGFDAGAFFMARFLGHVGLRTPLLQAVIEGGIVTPEHEARLLAALLECYTRARPLVFVLEDLHLRRAQPFDCCRS
ncbi:MAG: hypothetical protein QM756_04355 [Polyangiaceae bacterium]